MKSRSAPFNLNLIALGWALFLAACASPGTDEKATDAASRKNKKGKEASTLRLHLEVNPDGTESNSPVSVYREQPFMVNVNKNFFLNEGDVEEAAVVEVVGGFALRVQFDPHGTLVLDMVTSTYKGSRIAIFSQFGDARWLAAPRITQRIVDGVLTFTPDASQEEVERIVLGLNNIAKELKKKPRK